MIDRDTVMELASEAGFGSILPALADLPQTWVGADADRLQRFAALIENKAAEAEREACASMRDARAASYMQKFGSPGIAASARFNECAAVIRARGTGGEG